MENEERASVRRSFRERRNTLSALEQREAAAQLVQQYQQHPIYNNARSVGLYITHDGELGTNSLINHLWQHNKAVYLAVLHPFAKGHLLFLRYDKNTPMKANRFGILEPTLDCSAVCPLRELDILFTPLVAFDEQGNRLGMGGGFYDRTLAQLRKEKSYRPAIIGLAHDIQKTANLTVEAWDIPLSYVQTPSRLYDFSAS